MPKSNDLLKRIRMAMLAGVALSWSGTAAAEDISGVILNTVTISNNSRLVGHVTCDVANGPCIAFGAPGITLNLNGFSITGPAASPDNCVTTMAFLPEDGVASIGQSNVTIQGPGLIQRFRRHGIFLQKAGGITVRRVVSADNCFSGVQLNAVSDSEVVEIVSVRNAAASDSFPCGGNCITNSHRNRIHRSEFSGNGSVAAMNNDFGVGLVGTSTDNVIEENGIGGNTNGILIQMNSSGNTIRRNIIAGNPPVQVSAAFGAMVGFDIMNLAPAGANTFQENLCVTYSGVAPAACPAIPAFSGHRNNPPPAPVVPCTTPQPASNWLCVNGGWLPPGHPAALEAPGVGDGTPGDIPPPVGCTTPDPFAGIPGLVGVCINGGWVPTGHPLAGGGPQQ
jgi:parallel beta-helix repeat protein